MNGNGTIVALAILVLVSVASVKANSETRASRPKFSDDVIDIDDQNDGEAADLTATTTDDDDDLQDGSGSGKGDGTDEDDEDLVAGSGQGSSYPPDLVVDSLTPCQQLRKSSRHLENSYVPRCTKTGEYRKLQCSTKTECFCVDPQGTIIQGTAKNGDMTDIRRQPDCDGGNNLLPCVHMRVEALWKQYIAYSPSCTSAGEFEPVQCDKMNCWCVDHLGMEIGNSRVSIPSRPDCTASTSVIQGGKPTDSPTERSTKKHHKHKHNKHKPGHAYDPSVDIDMTGQPPYTYDDDDIDHHDDGEEMDIDDFTGEENSSLEPGDPKAQKTPTTIMAQPGILAGIIGGAVVGLLCAILLIMFIVYRMRKKDEGSYALDEPTKARGAYAYQKAPSKEFYA